MGKTANVLKAELRKKYVDFLMKALADLGEDVYLTESNKFAFPTLDEEGGERFIEITVKVPQTAQGEVYDCYTAAEMYKEKVENNRRKKEEQEKKKAEKIKRDKERREKIKAAKEKNEKGE